MNYTTSKLHECLLPCHLGPFLNSRIVHEATENAGAEHFSPAHVVAFINLGLNIQRCLLETTPETVLTILHGDYFCKTAAMP